MVQAVVAVVAVRFDVVALRRAGSTPRCACRRGRCARRRHAPTANAGRSGRLADGRLPPASSAAVAAAKQHAIGAVPRPRPETRPDGDPDSRCRWCRSTTAGWRDQSLEEADIRFRSDDLAPRQRIAQALQRLGAIDVEHDQLGDHRVVEDASPCRPRSRRHRYAHAPRSSGRRKVCSLPEPGRKFWSGSSAYRRTSIAWPCART